ncbi:hypothetical protein ABW20_dc0106470 [Dactylellina cionopaga]|nr:hypothetical protein ABW20_dc0106470 [Dactylellina cionopaga]
MEWVVREQAPAILATLLTDNQRLQAAAVDAGAIKRLTGMLRRAFDALPASGDNDSSILESHEMVWNDKVRAHQLRVREGTLRALAAIALFEDEHRKKIIESGALGFVVGSLTPDRPLEAGIVIDRDMVMGGTQDQISSNSQLPTILENESNTFAVPDTSRTGNPVGVLIAATNVVRSLSRSVNVLSTSLIDWHVEGTLIGDFDSNKEALRLNAIWALKHLVLKQDEAVISSCLAAFETSWLLEQVAIEDCSSSYNSHTDHLDPSDEGRQLLESHNIEFSEKVIDRLSSNYAAPKLEDQRKKALLEFQEQALDFFRNIMAGPNASVTFRQILNDTKGMTVGSILSPVTPPFRTPFYDILTEKLKSKPGERIVLAIIYVLVHIGACAEHRALLIEQSALFYELIKLFEVQVDQIRIGLSWLAINLTWKENNGLNADFTRRVQKLREYRYVDKLEWLKSGGIGESEEGQRKPSRALGEGVAIGMGEINNVRNPDGEVIRSGPPNVNMSLDLRERCRQALAQINDQ